MADCPSRNLNTAGTVGISRRNLRRNAVAAAALAALLGAGACTADESQQPAVDPAGNVLFTGEREKAVPTTEAAPATSAEVTEQTYHFGSTTTTTPATTEVATETTEATSTTQG
jgi:hypothetical protein